MFSNETKIYMALLTGMAVIILFLTFFTISIIHFHRKYRRLYGQLLTAEISGAEDERKRIAADLHDDFGQLLSIVKMQVNNINGREDKDTELISIVTEQVNDIVKRMKHMGEKIMPSALLRNGFVKAVEEQVTMINRLGDLYIRFSYKPAIPMPGQEGEVHLYRIVQEIINNAIKHAGMAELVITLSQEADTLVLTAADNGNGFSINDRVEEIVGKGLRNIYNRVELLNGEVTLATAPGEGVRYDIKIPVTYETGPDNS